MTDVPPIAIEIETALFTPGIPRTAAMPASTAGPPAVANWIVMVAPPAAAGGVAAALGVASGAVAEAGVATGPALASVCSISIGSILAVMLSVGSGFRAPGTR